MVGESGEADPIVAAVEEFKINDSILSRVAQLSAEAAD